MRAGLVTGLFALAVLAASLTFVRRSGGTPSRSDAATAGDHSGETQPATDSPRDRSGSDYVHRESVVESPAAADIASTTSDQPYTLRVYVYHGNHSPVARATVQATGSTATTNLLGIAVLRLTTKSCVVHIEPPTGSRLMPARGRFLFDDATEREVHVQLESRNSTTFIVRLVDANHGAALTGVQIEHQTDTHIERLRSDADGIVHVESSPDQGYLAVTQPDLEPLRIATGAGHETRDRALTVELRAAAQLVAHLLDDATRPVAGAQLRLTAISSDLTRPPGSYRGPYEQTWDAVAGDDGIARITGLPVSVALAYQILVAGRTVTPTSVSVTLDSGIHERTFRVPSLDGVVRGIVVDLFAKPVVGVRIGAVRATLVDDPAPRSMPYWLVAKEQPTPRTDSGGRFQLALPRSAWVIGILPEPPGATSGLEVPTVCTRVDLTTTGATPTLRLVAPRGQQIHGVVLGPDRTPLPNVSVTGDHADSGHYASALSAENGTFVMRRLMTGTYDIEVSQTYEGPLATRAPVRVEAGSRDVQLVLDVVAGELSGEVIDQRSGNSTRAKLTARMGDLAIASDAGLDGRFSFLGLSAGDWVLTASDRGGRAAYHRVQVEAGGKHRLRVAMVRGGDLVLRHDTVEPDVAFEILRDGAVVREDPIGNPEVGRVARICVVPGPYTVRLLRAGEEFYRRQITIAAGQTIEVTAPD